MGITAFLPPAPEDLELAKKINNRLPNGSHVDFYRIDTGEGMERYGCVYQYHTKRKPVEQDWPFYDADTVIHQMALFVNECRYEEAQQWSLTPP